MNRIFDHASGGAVTGRQIDRPTRVTDRLRGHSLHSCGAVQAQPGRVSGLASRLSRRSPSGPPSAAPGARPRHARHERTTGPRQAGLDLEAAASIHAWQWAWATMNEARDATKAAAARTAARSAPQPRVISCALSPTLSPRPALFLTMARRAVHLRLRRVRPGAPPPVQT